VRARLAESPPAPPRDSPARRYSAAAASARPASPGGASTSGSRSRLGPKPLDRLGGAAVQLAPALAQQRAVRGVAHQRVLKA
jgi:hypothetical protein